MQADGSSAKKAAKKAKNTGALLDLLMAHG